MTATATDELALLEFDPTLPCETGRAHLRTGCDEPARYIVAASCPKCGAGDQRHRLVCEPCWHLAGETGLCCQGCGGEFDRDEGWTVLHVIGGA